MRIKAVSAAVGQRTLLYSHPGMIFGFAFLIERTGYKYKSAINTRSFRIYLLLYTSGYTYYLYVYFSVCSMSILSQIKESFSAPVKKEEKYEFSDDDRELSALRRAEKAAHRKEMEYLKEKLQRKIELLEKRRLEEQIADLDDQLYDRDDEGDNDSPAAGVVGDDPDALMMGLLMQVLNGQRAAPQAAPTGQPPSPVEIDTKINVPDEKLKEMISRIPSPFMKKLKKMDDAELIETGKAYVPDFFTKVDEDTISRAIRLIRS